MIFKKKHFRLLLKTAGISVLAGVSLAGISLVMGGCTSKTAPTVPVVPVSAAKEKNVSISSTGLDPRQIWISPGDIIVWTNKDSVTHTLEAIFLDSDIPIAPGNRFKFKFDDVGANEYIDVANPGQTGRVNVQ
jgi:plastocyanin